ncbi:MAG: N-acetylmuramoyl-L-alanine amidase [Gaiellaceae bacterium]
MKRVLLLVVLAVLAAPAAAAAAPVICIDPGHASEPNLTTEPIGPGSSIRKMKDGGGTAGEASVVLQIGKKLRLTLMERGYSVVMTRTTMEFTLGNGGNIARAQFCNRHAAALMIRIHADGSTDPSRHGAATLYPAWHAGWTADILPESRRAAGLLQARLVARTGAADLGLVARGDLTGFNWANVPVVLAETGFMTNARERARLTSAAYQWRVAKGLANGAAAFAPF